MKIARKNYMKPTPKNLRRLGDSLLIVGTTLTAAAITKDADIVAYISLAVTLVGKFLTNYFKVESK